MNASCLGWNENRIDAALRQANVVHELTHAAVVKANWEETMRASTLMGRPAQG